MLLDFNNNIMNKIPINWFFFKSCWLNLFKVINIKS